MSVIDGMMHRLRVLWRGERYADEQEREMAFHLELDAASRVRGDGDPELAARRAFGNVTVQREAARGESVLRFIDRVRQDGRYALRGLRRQPAFTAMVVVTLALGFGVNAAMFSLLDALYVHTPDGVAAPQSVRRFYTETHRARVPGGIFTFDRFEYAQYRAMMRADSTLPIALVTDPDSVSLSVDGARLDANESEVTRSFFPILGIRPQLGRFFAPEEDSIETPTLVAVVSADLWRRAFNADPHVLGKKIDVDHRVFTVVGVAPEQFRGVDLAATDLWVPLNTHQGYPNGRPERWYNSFGLSARLLARVESPAQESRIRTIVERSVRSVEIPGFQRDPHASVVAGSIIGLRGPMTPETAVSVGRRTAWVALIVLVIAIANVLNLLLLRAARRQREVALRRALGVSRLRLLGQLTVEGVMLALIGGLAAVIVAQWVGAALRVVEFPRLMHWTRPPVTAPTLVFILALSLAVGLLAGIAPAFKRADADIVNALRAGQRESGYRSSGIRSALLAAQAALCAVLLVGAGLFVRSLSNVRSIDIGYDVDNVTMLWPVFPDGTGAHNDQLRTTIPHLVDRVAQLPGVRAAASASVGPMWGFGFRPMFLPDRDSLPRTAADHMGPSDNVISPDFFNAVGMRILRGRPFRPADGPNAPRVVIINQTFARVVWPSEDPIGKCLIVDARTAPCTTVIGVVSDAHRGDVIEPPAMMVYFPLAQGEPWDSPRVVLVRTRPGMAAGVLREASNELKTAFPNADAAAVLRLSAAVDAQARSWSLGATLFTAFGLLAFLVAGVGVYSVVAYGAAQRTHEMGVRIALGANASEIIDLVLADGLRAVTIGIAIGLLAAVLLGRFISSMLFGVTPTDPSIMILVAVSLCVLGAVASLVPALRASRVDPMAALRSD